MILCRWWNPETQSPTIKYSEPELFDLTPAVWWSGDSVEQVSVRSGSAPVLWSRVRIPAPALVTTTGQSADQEKLVSAFTFFVSRYSILPISMSALHYSWKWDERVSIGSILTDNWCTYLTLPLIHQLKFRYVYYKHSC